MRHGQFRVRVLRHTPGRGRWEITRLNQFNQNPLPALLSVRRVETLLYMRGVEVTVQEREYVL
jgi:hypothetical protein